MLLKVWSCPKLKIFSAQPLRPRRLCGENLLQKPHRRDAENAEVTQRIAQVRTTRKVFVAILILVLLCIAAPIRNPNLVSAQIQQKPQQKKSHYACPMHPEVTSAKRGKCPKCGMALRLVADEVAASTTPVSNNVVQLSADAPSISSSRIPDIRVYDQNGKRLNFYSDLIKGKTVAINFIFTTCTTICPPLTATFRRVQQDLTQQSLPAQLISISVDPATDTPERLRDFAAKFKAGPGWTFVTGDKTEIDSLLRALGAAVADKNDHTPMILVGNDATGYWTRTYGLSSPTALVKVIAAAAATNSKVP